MINCIANWFMHRARWQAAQLWQHSCQQQMRSVYWLRRLYPDFSVVFSSAELTNNRSDFRSSALRFGDHEFFAYEWNRTTWVSPDCGPAAVTAPRCWCFAAVGGTTRRAAQDVLSALNLPCQCTLSTKAPARWECVSNIK